MKDTMIIQKKKKTRTDLPGMPRSNGVAVV